MYSLQETMNIMYDLCYHQNIAFALDNRALFPPFEELRQVFDDYGARSVTVSSSSSSSSSSFSSLSSSSSSSSEIMTQFQMHNFIRVLDVLTICFQSRYLPYNCKDGLKISIFANAYNQIKKYVYL